MISLTCWFIYLAASPSSFIILSQLVAVVCPCYLCVADTVSAGVRLFFADLTTVADEWLPAVCPSQVEASFSRQTRSS